MSLIAEAEQAARAIADRKSQAAALIAVAEAAVGINRDLTMILVRDAEDSLHDIRSPYPGEDVVIRLAEILALTGQPDDRIQKTIRKTTKGIQPWALEIVIEAFVGAGLLDCAVLTAQRIGELNESKGAKYQPSTLGSFGRAALGGPPNLVARIQARAFAALAEALVTTRPDQAAALAAAAEGAARSVEDFEFRESALVPAIRARAVTGAWRHAEETATSLSDPELKVTALIAVADSLVSFDKTRAVAVMKAAERAAHSITSRETQAKALTAMAETVITFDKDWAVALAEAAEQAARSGTSPDHRTKVLMAVAKGLAAAGERDRAERAARMIADSPTSRDETLAAVAQRLAAAREWDRAEGIGRVVKLESYKDMVFRALSESLAAAGQWDRAERATRMMADSSISRSEALAAVAQRLAAAGKLGRAKRTIRAIEYFPTRCDVLTSIAQILIAARQWDRVDSLGRDTEFPDASVTILCDMAEALVNDNPRRALASIDEAEQIACDITHDEIRSEALGKVAETLTAFGNGTVREKPSSLCHTHPERPSLSSRP